MLLLLVLLLKACSPVRRWSIRLPAILPTRRPTSTAPPSRQVWLPSSSTSDRFDLVRRRRAPTALSLLLLNPQEILEIELRLVVPKDRCRPRGEVVLLERRVMGVVWVVLTGIFERLTHYRDGRGTYGLTMMRARERGRVWHRVVCAMRYDPMATRSVVRWSKARL